MRRLEEDHVGAEGVLVGPAAAGRDGDVRLDASSSAPSPSRPRRWCPCVLQDAPAVVVARQLDGGQRRLIAHAPAPGVNVAGPPRRSRPAGLDSARGRASASRASPARRRRRTSRRRSMAGSRCSQTASSDALHVLGLRRSIATHGVLLGQHQAELAVGAVAAVAVPRHPELEAVALPPVRVRLVGVGDVRAGGLGDPRLGQQPARRPRRRAAGRAGRAARWRRWWRAGR